jgi:hypothetical protein
VRRTIRPLTPGEVLACWDVPEKLGQLGGSEDVKRALMGDIFTPLKIRKNALEDIKHLSNKLLSAKDVMPQERNAGLDEGVRGPSLKFLRQEEEK